MTKPDKAKTVEMHLCQMARSGQLQSKFTDEQLIALLERLSEQTKKKNVVNVIQNFLILYKTVIIYTNIFFLSMIAAAFNSIQTLTNFEEEKLNDIFLLFWNSIYFG